MAFGVLGLRFYDMLFSLLSSLVVFNNCKGVLIVREGEKIASGASEQKLLTLPTLVYMRGA